MSAAQLGSISVIIGHLEANEIAFVPLGSAVLSLVALRDGSDGWLRCALFPQASHDQLSFPASIVALNSLNDSLVYTVDLKSFDCDSILLDGIMGW